MMNSQNAMAQMNRLRDELDRVFGGEALHWNRATTFPPVNIWEDENGFYVEAELPGMGLDDLEIFIHEGDELSIKGVRKEREIEGSWRRRERAHGEFSRAFKLPDAVDVNNVAAEMKDGVLTVSLPKSEAVKPKKIEVKAKS